MTNASRTKFLETNQTVFLFTRARATGRRLFCRDVVAVAFERVENTWLIHLCRRFKRVFKNVSVHKMCFTRKHYWKRVPTAKYVTDQWSPINNTGITAVQKTRVKIFCKQSKVYRI